MESKKISDYVIEIKNTTTPSPVTTTQTYDRKFIEGQIVSITAQRDAMIAQKQAELDECNAILAEMDKLGIITKSEVVE